VASLCACVRTGQRAGTYPLKELVVLLTDAEVGAELNGASDGALRAGTWRGGGRRPTVAGFKAPAAPVNAQGGVLLAQVGRDLIRSGVNYEEKLLASVAPGGDKKHPAIAEDTLRKVLDDLGVDVRGNGFRAELRALYDDKARNRLLDLVVFLKYVGLPA
jgi:hypothetical protein